MVALISGLTDVDAISLSSLRLYGMEKLSAGETVTAILIAILSNLVFKFGVVAMIGGRALIVSTMAGFAGIAAGCLAGWALIF